MWYAVKEAVITYLTFKHNDCLFFLATGLWLLGLQDNHDIIYTKLCYDINSAHTIFLTGKQNILKILIMFLNGHDAMKMKYKKSN